jgi:hypothetical protein
MSKTSQSPDIGKMAREGFAQVMDTMEFVKRTWSNFNLATPFTPTLSIEELDKRITDLRAVEQWLLLNQNMLRSTIQALELQRGTLNAINTMSSPFGNAVQSADMAQTPVSFAASAAQKAVAAPPDTAAPASGAPPQEAAAPAPADDRPDLLQATGVNPLAWWNLLQDSFWQIAQAATDQATANAAGRRGTGKTAAPARSARPPTRAKAKRAKAGSTRGQP